MKEILEYYYKDKSNLENLLNDADPLQIARNLKLNSAILICALFAYGNAKNIVNFLKKLDFDLLASSEDRIRNNLKNLKYRFQSNEDLCQIFITLRRFELECSMGEILLNAYNKADDKNPKLIQALNVLIDKILSLNSYRSMGYDFYFSKPFLKYPKSPYKRYNMFLRWLVRDKDIDLGRFTFLPKNELIIPLDTHTHKVSLSIGLIQRNTYDFKAALELTNKLKEFDPNDPIKYDFALYRIGQKSELNKVIEKLNLKI